MTKYAKAAIPTARYWYWLVLTIAQFSNSFTAFVQAGGKLKGVEPLYMTLKRSYTTSIHPTNKDFHPLHTLVSSHGCMSHLHLQRLSTFYRGSSVTVIVEQMSTNILDNAIVRE